MEQREKIGLDSDQEEEEDDFDNEEEVFGLDVGDEDDNDDDDEYDDEEIDRAVAKRLGIRQRVDSDDDDEEEQRGEDGKKIIKIFESSCLMVFGILNFFLTFFFF
jgi:hypothetical protein